jgi:zinc transport system ATP-binding protein
MNKEVINLKDVWVRYEDITVLEGINLVVQQHDFLGLIGPNGGGKSTLIKVILGMIKPCQGTVSVLDAPPRKSRDHTGLYSY